MKRTKSGLRNNAKMAKQRLANGFWEQKHSRQSLENINNPDADDENLYRQVQAVLSQGITNPLQAVLDHEYMATLDENARQRYVLNTSNLVNKCIQRYKSCTLTNMITK